VGEVSGDSKLLSHVGDRLHVHGCRKKRKKRTVDTDEKKKREKGHLLADSQRIARWSKESPVTYSRRKKKTRTTYQPQPLFCSKKKKGAVTGKVQIREEKKGGFSVSA